MKLNELVKLVNEGNANGGRVYVTRHLTGRVGPVYEAKALGFGTGDVMLRIGGQRDWITKDPMMCTVEVIYPDKPGVHNTPHPSICACSECRAVRDAKHAQDKTDYARAAGYQGEKRVLVSDGRVISHRSVCWFAFCAGLRQKSGGVVS
jgi:hypothetical protein